MLVLLALRRGAVIEPSALQVVTNKFRSEATGVGREGNEDSNCSGKKISMMMHRC